MEKSILLVDDEEGIRTVLGITLADMGYRVLTAENGSEAVRILKDQSPSIVLTDIKMPEMDGIDLLRRIKEINPDTEVIMMTGHGDMDLAIKSVKYEATDFVTKPINDGILEIALNRAGERIDIRRQLNEYTQNLEQLVHEKSQKLVEAERLAAIGQTVADISHAIKNIAGGLKGGAFVLEKGIELGQRQYLLQGWEMIKGNVDKITNLSMDLLNYARGIQVQSQLVDPNLPAQEVVQLMLPVAEEQGIDLQFEPDRSLEEMYFDAELIHSCLLNLVTNAIDACKSEKSGSSNKVVKISTAKRRGWGAEYQVVDNGSGMNAETKKKIFQRFFTTKGSAGTGIGLMATQKIVDAHEGEIQVESEKNRGSKFTIRIPLRLNIDNCHSS
ncbi:MAG: hybrid sensor histidine kinase/response regulator [Desulfobacterales bacterium]|nr:hybrid sensor histidine kinase/response regulator [Desulfobacterales bacterium]